MAVLSEQEVGEALAELPGWEAAGGRLTKEYVVGDFREAVALVVRIAFEAEAANHHPDLDVRYNRLRVGLSTHSEGGVTEKDLDLARTVESLSSR